MKCQFTASGGKTRATSRSAALVRDLDEIVLPVRKHRHRQPRRRRSAQRLLCASRSLNRDSSSHAELDMSTEHPAVFNLVATA
jgi:hypothetical protein